jgi:nucleoside phosphorylase
VIADYVHYSEYTKVVPGTPLRRYATYDQPSVSLRQRHAEPVLNRNGWQDTITVNRPVDGRPKAVVGAIVAGEKVLGDPKAEAQRYVAHTFDNAIAVDMESFGVGRAVHDVRREVDYNPRLLIIRGVSDTVEIDEVILGGATPEADGQTDNNAQRREWKDYAAASAAAFASEIVGRLCDSDDLRKAEREAE